VVAGGGIEPPIQFQPVRPEPTTEDQGRVISYLLRQTAECPCALAAWLVRQENAYYEGPGRNWDCGMISYAAARDAASWQLNRSERAVWEFLETCANTAL